MKKDEEANDDDYNIVICGQCKNNFAVFEGEFKVETNGKLICSCLYCGTKKDVK